MAARRSSGAAIRDGGRWGWVLQVEVSTMIKAPRQTVLDVYADYPRWPRLFPTISAVRLLGREGPKLVLEVDHVEGKVINELVVCPPAQLDLWEEKRRYDALFRNRFEPIPDGTRFTVRGEIQRLQLQPVKAEAEGRARVAETAAPNRRGESHDA